MKIDLKKAVAAAQKHNIANGGVQTAPAVFVPEVQASEATPQQLATLATVIENAAANAEAKKEKKQKEAVSTDRAINTQKQANTQGRQPTRVVAGKMPAFLAGYYFASASARTRKSEAELAGIVAEATANGKLMELLGGGDGWQFAQVPPTTMTGQEWSEQAPETEFYITKGEVRQLVLDILDENWEAHFGKETVNPLAE